MNNAADKSFDYFAQAARLKLQDDTAVNNFAANLTRMLTTIDDAALKQRIMDRYQLPSEQVTAEHVRAALTK